MNPVTSSDTRLLSGIVWAMPYTAARPVSSSSGWAMIWDIVFRRLTRRHDVYQCDRLVQILNKAVNNARPEQIGHHVKLDCVRVLETRQHPTMLLIKRNIMRMF